MKEFLKAWLAVSAGIVVIGYSFTLFVWAFIRLYDLVQAHVSTFGSIVLNAGLLVLLFSFVIAALSYADD